MILIGNIISFVAALFLIASCIATGRREIFLLQFAESVLWAIANIFFCSFSGVTMLLLTAVRNLFIVKDKFTKPIMFCYVVLAIIIGLISNNRGFIGILPVIATVEYTICCYYISDVNATRISIFINVLIWIIYALLIFDLSTVVTFSVVLVIDFIAIVNVYIKKSLKK